MFFESLEENYSDPSAVSSSTPLDADMELSISELPIEILTEIFLNLNSDDMVRCSYVCLQWREIINSNRIWSVQCSKERIRHKEYLQNIPPLINNPVKIFRDHEINPKASRLTVPCHWRSHYNRYKFLERNWRKGNYTMIRTKFDIEHYREGLLISIDVHGLNVHSVYDFQHPCRIKKDPSLNVDAIRVKDGLVFYTQGSRLFCFKKSKYSFIKHYEHNFSNCTKQHSSQHTVSEPILSLKITDKFMVVQDKRNACFLNFYNYKTGEFLLNEDLHNHTGRVCPTFTCLEAYDDKVFVAYSLKQHYILIYDFKLNKVDVKVETLLRSSELIVSKNYFCSKLTSTQFDKKCELHVWSVNSGKEVEHVTIKRRLPVVLTLDDRLIYSEHKNIINVKDLTTSKHLIDFTVDDRIHGMEFVCSNLLVINLTASVQLWDMSTGQKLYTYLRDNIEDFWVDDRHIVIRIGSRSWTASGCVFAFW